MPPAVLALLIASLASLSAHAAPPPSLFSAQFGILFAADDAQRQARQLADQVKDEPGCRRYRHDITAAATQHYYRGTNATSVLEILARARALGCTQR